MSGSSSASEWSRLTNERFNEYALFQESGAQINNMPLEKIIRFFGLTSILSAFASCKFPSAISMKLMEIVETNVKAFWEEPRLPGFLASQSFEELQGLRSKIVSQLETLAQSREAWDFIIKPEQENSFISVHETFVREYQKFVQVVNRYFIKVENILNELISVTNLDQDRDQELMLSCLEIIEEAHTNGKEWAREFFEYQELACAKLSVVYSQQHYNQSYVSHHSTLQTLKERDADLRFIRYSIVPQFFKVKDFTMLGFMFFHEYTAHLVASMYPDSYEGELITKIQRINCRMPDELTHGWMFYAAQTFFEDKIRFRVDSPHRIATPMEIAIWLASMLNSEYQQTFSNKTLRGVTIARDFLDLLEKQVCNGDKARANKLYYRLSFDVITRYPLSSFSYEGFIDALERWLGDERRQQLDEIIQRNCLRKEGTTEFIRLDELWSRIKRPEPMVNLPT